MGLRTIDAGRFKKRWFLLYYYSFLDMVLIGPGQVHFVVVTFVLVSVKSKFAFTAHSCTLDLTLSSLPRGSAMSVLGRPGSSSHQCALLLLLCP